MGLTVRIGTRGSKLALWQANWVASAIKADLTSISTELVIIKTKGDKVQDVPLAQIGGKALFIKEIEEALLNGSIDIAVHSMKDMPAEMPDGLCMGAIPEREITADVLISKNGFKLAELKAGSRIGTGSLRRRALLRYARPDILVVPLRGNLDTRIKKLETENLSGIILAAAGMKRMGWEGKISEYLDETVMLPAVGQGALCIEIRQYDTATEKTISHLDHYHTRAAVTAERSFLNQLGGSCHVPVAALGKVKNDRLILEGLVADIDGKTLIRDSISGSVSTPEIIGFSLAERLISKGAESILERVEEREEDKNER